MNEGNAFCQASKNLLAGWSAIRTLRGQMKLGAKRAADFKK